MSLGTIPQSRKLSKKIQEAIGLEESRWLPEEDLKMTNNLVRMVPQERTLRNTTVEVKAITLH